MHMTNTYTITPTVTVHLYLLCESLKSRDDTSEYQFCIYPILSVIVLWYRIKCTISPYGQNTQIWNVVMCINLSGQPGPFFEYTNQRIFPFFRTRPSYFWRKHGLDYQDVSLARFTLIKELRFMCNELCPRNSFESVRFYSDSLSHKCITISRVMYYITFLKTQKFYLFSKKKPFMVCRKVMSYAHNVK